MTILFAGGEMGAFTPSDSTVREALDGGKFNGSFARCAMNMEMPTSYALSEKFASATEAWIHFEHYLDSASSDGTMRTGLQVLDASGNAVIRMQTQEDSDGWRFEYWNGSAWVLIGSELYIETSAVQTIDIHAKVNSATGSIAVYFEGTKRAEVASADLSGITNIAQLAFYGRAGAYTERFISQVIVATETTIGWRLTTVAPTATGASSAWTGTVAEVDEAIVSDADFINTSSNDQDELFAHGTAIPAGYAVRGVVVTARAKKGSSGPSNLQLALRSSGTTYYSASKALDFGYGAYVSVWETDPATGAAFTASAVTSAQFGVRSKA